METRYPHVVRAIAEQPWALQPEKLAAMLDVIRFRNAGGHLTLEEIHSRVGARRYQAGEGYFEPDTERFYRPRRDAETGALLGYFALDGTPRPASAPVVAVLGIYGIISQRADMFTEMSGGTSIERVSARFRQALADPAVKAIVFDFDSPGGGVYGVDELAAEIREARGQKPSAAVANSLAASAGYWLASAAGELSVTPSGEVGSIGVYAAHEDLSGMMEQDGVKMTLISAGKYKTEGNPFEPLSDEAKGYLQGRVDDYYRAFVGAVAKGRGVTPESVRKGFGQGRVVGAQAAKAEGMADRIETLDEALRRIGARRKATPSVAESVTPDHRAKLEREAAAARAEMLRS